MLSLAANKIEMTRPIKRSMTGKSRASSYGERIPDNSIVLADQSKRVGDSITLDDKKRDHSRSLTMLPSKSHDRASREKRRRRSKQKDNENPGRLTEKRINTSSDENSKVNQSKNKNRNGKKL